MMTEAKLMSAIAQANAKEAAASAMLAALRQIVEFSTNMGDGEDQPEDTEWDSMQDAYDQGCRSSAWDAAATAREAIKAAKAAGIA